MIGEKRPNTSGPGTVVGANVKLVGTLSDASDIIIHGTIEGEIISSQSVTIAETAYVKGPISAEIVSIGGKVNGSITATGKLEILPTGKVFGSITSKDLSIRSGAIFIGKCTMPEGEKEAAAAAKEAVATSTTSTSKEAPKGEADYEVE